MRKFIWRFRAALILRKYGWKRLAAWDYAGALIDPFFYEGFSPEEAIYEDISYG